MHLFICRSTHTWGKVVFLPPLLWIVHTISWDLPWVQTWDSASLFWVEKNHYSFQDPHHKICRIYGNTVYFYIFLDRISEYLWMFLMISLNNLFLHYKCNILIRWLYCKLRLNFFLVNSSSSNLNWTVILKSTEILGASGKG